MEFVIYIILTILFRMRIYFINFLYGNFNLLLFPYEDKTLLQFCVLRDYIIFRLLLTSIYTYKLVILYMYVYKYIC